MNNLMDLIQNVLSNQEMDVLSKEVNASPQQTEAASQSIISVLLGALSKNASTDEGASSLNRALETDNHSSLLGNLFGLITGGQQESNVKASNGVGIVGHILGDKAGFVVESISKATGMDAGSIGTLLIKLAPVVMAVLGKVKQDENLNEQGVASVLRGTVEQNASSNPIFDFASKMLDQDGDGSIMDDISNMGMKILGGFFKK